jgi:hypothetical protein
MLNLISTALFGPQAKPTLSHTVHWSIKCEVRWMMTSTRLAYAPPFLPRHNRSKMEQGLHIVDA